MEWNDTWILLFAVSSVREPESCRTYVILCVYSSSYLGLLIGKPDPIYSWTIHKHYVLSLAVAGAWYLVQRECSIFATSL